LRCWKVTGTAGGAALSFVVQVIGQRELERRARRRQAARAGPLRTTKDTALERRDETLAFGRGTAGAGRVLAVSS
jgi:hypothetical protein